jgi:hypothetical protein
VYAGDGQRDTLRGRLIELVWSLVIIVVISILSARKRSHEQREPENVDNTSIQE